MFTKKGQLATVPKLSYNLVVQYRKYSFLCPFRPLRDYVQKKSLTHVMKGWTKLSINYWLEAVPRIVAVINIC